MSSAITAAIVLGTLPSCGCLSDSNAFSTAARLVSAISWPSDSAARNRWSVFGFASAHALVTTYPSIGKSVVAPWFRSASGTAPYCCSAMLANGSGMVAAAILPVARSPAMSGNGIAPSVAAKALSVAVGNFTSFGVDAVLLEHRDVEQVVDVVRRVHPDQLALELGERA